MNSKIFATLALVCFMATIVMSPAKAEEPAAVDICTLVPFSDASSSDEDEKVYGCKVVAALDLGKGDRIEQVRKQLQRMSPRSFARWKKQFSYLARLYAYRALHHKGYHWRAMFKRKGHETQYLDDKAMGAKLRGVATDLDVIKASRDAHRAMKRSRRYKRRAAKKGSSVKCKGRCPAP